MTLRYLFALSYSSVFSFYLLLLFLDACLFGWFFLMRDRVYGFIWRKKGRISEEFWRRNLKLEYIIWNNFTGQWCCTPLIPVLRWQEQVYLSESQVSLVYKVSSSTTRTVSQKKKKKKKIDKENFLMECDCMINNDLEWWNVINPHVI